MLKNIIIAFFIITVFFSCTEVENGTQPVNKNDAITQYGNKQAFLDQQYVGTDKYSDIIKEGDFALGTFNYVDGEMAAIDNNFMRIPVSGEVHPASDTLMAPFAVVKFFETDNKFSVTDKKTMFEIWSITKEQFSDTSKPIAVKVTGSFSFVKARSVHKQTEPFQTLQEIVANQAVFEFENISGSMVGYWFPKYMDGVNFPGFHFHFLSNDLKRGGHLLDCAIESGKIEIDYADKLIVR